MGWACEVSELLRWDVPHKARNSLAILPRKEVRGADPRIWPRKGASAQSTALGFSACVLVWECQIKHIRGVSQGVLV